MIYLSSLPKDELDIQSDPSCSQSSPPIISTLMNASTMTQIGGCKACTLCSQPILDQFLFYVDSLPFHSHCLRCSVCDLELGYSDKCYIKDNLLFCRQDYFSKFGCRCSKCGEPISVNEFCMRANDAFFHVSCFTCVLCAVPLLPGDLIRANNNGEVLCHLHYQNMMGGGGTQSVEALDLQQQQQPQQQPRKPRKDDSSGENEAGDLEFDNDDVSSCGRSKRMRTSFKHHQLRTMKTYFNLNHNPDAKDLKQLAQKTGLTKRVLQVWFQNARAKYRRSMQHRDNSSVSPGFGAALDNTQIPSTSSVSSTQQSPTPSFPSGITDSKMCEYFEEAPTPTTSNNSSVL